MVLVEHKRENKPRGGAMNRKFWVGLSLIPDIGPMRLRRLLNYFHSPQRIWYAEEEELLQIYGFGQKLVNQILKSREELDLSSFLEYCEKSGIKILTLADEDYPKNLREIYNPPPVLYYRGSIQPEDINALAIVGSRKMSAYGARVARKITKELVEKSFTIVSGLALGVDKIAHETALKAGGRTIGVLGSGIDVIYPREHRKLAQEISNSGALISTFPPKTAPERGNFPARNRIISGLTYGTIIIEAKNRSGALITAEHALEQNREVFAIPGNIFSSLSNGTNKLIQNGAKLVMNCDDIIVELTGILSGTASIINVKQKEMKENLSPIKVKIISLLECDLLTIDELLQKSNLELGELNTVLFELELEGVIDQFPGMKFGLI